MPRARKGSKSAPTTSGTPHGSKAKKHSTSGKLGRKAGKKGGY